MEYVILIMALAGFMLVVFVLESIREKKRQKYFVELLQRDPVKAFEKQYSTERFEKLDSYFKRHQEEGQLDRVTWNDLGMDDIFKKLNFTFSSTGEEYLYYTLRTPRQKEEEVSHFNELVDFFTIHHNERIALQILMKKIGHTGKYSLYDYIDNLDLLGERNSRREILLDLLFIPFIVLMFFSVQVGILCVVGLMIYNIISYFKQKDLVNPYITSFAYVIRLLETAASLAAEDWKECGGEMDRIRTLERELHSLTRKSFFVRDWGISVSGRSSGDLIGMLMDYIRMVFHFDLLKFNSMLHFLRQNLGKLDELIGVMGYLETASAISVYRETLGDAWCRPEFCREQQIAMENGYHPLIENPVCNSFQAERGMLITGSNASGKSTFLKTVGINAVFAQTICTCLAEKFVTGLFVIYSSMALRDSIENGESYFIVEIKALKRIAAAAEAGKRVLCFVDEVLRGTNTVERIAASSQILRFFQRENILCFAATHDIELTSLLEGYYDNYHFEEVISQGDILFPFRLLPGKATSRNAIKLLEVLGYHDKIVKDATAQAEHFLETGEWILMDCCGKAGE